MLDMKTSMTEHDEKLADLVCRIRAHIDQQFASGRTRVFLSSLGSELAVEKQRAEEISGLKFAEFLRANFDFPVGRTGAHENVLFIVPAGTSPNVVDETGPRFHSSFWTAFARPLVENEQRFINLSSLRFGAKEEVAGNGDEDIREIEGRFVATEEASRNVSDMLRRIDEWLADQCLDRDRFLAKERKAQPRKASLLAAIIDSLSVDQLRRISLPLDVVKTLLS